MKIKKLALVFAALLVAGLAVVSLFWDTAGLVAGKQHKNSVLIEEQLAYHYGVMAYLYGYPIVDMHQQMHNETHRVAKQQTVLAPVNSFYRFANLITPETNSNLRAPNNDTLYYSAWVDVSKEPVILHTPNTDGRYFTIAVTNQFAEVQHLGRSTTGTAEAYFALTGPNWHGALPANTRQIKLDTPIAWLLGRMLVDGTQDLAQAKALVDEIWLSPLNGFNWAMPPVASSKPATATPLDILTSLDFFSVLNKHLRVLPRRPGETALLAQFDQIGVGPESTFDAKTASAATIKGLRKALKDGHRIVAASTFRTTSSVNGWMVSQSIGRYGFQFMHRASVVRGGYGNLPEESLYAAALFDADGDLLEGSRHLQIEFQAGELPPVKGFWSIAAYTLDAKLMRNEIARYSIGDRTPGLTFAADGRLTLRLQHAAPSGVENWLPTPAGKYFLVLRLYEPDRAALESKYLYPAVRKVKE